MNPEILEAAESAQPELMQKTAQALTLIEKMAPEFMEDVISDFETISSVTLEKVAGVPPIVKEKLLGAGALVGTAIAAGLGTSIATDLFDAAKRGLTKSRNFKRIMEANPGLKNVAEPKRLKPAFDMVHRYAPDFTSDPMLGGSLITAIVNQPPGHEYNLIKELLGARKNLSDIKGSQFRPDFGKLIGGPSKETPEQKLEHAKKIEDYKAGLRKKERAEIDKDAEAYKQNQGEYPPWKR